VVNYNKNPAEGWLVPVVAPGKPERAAEVVPVSCTTTQDLSDAVQCSLGGKLHTDDRQDIAEEVKGWEALADVSGEDALNVVNHKGKTIDEDCSIKDYFQMDDAETLNDSESEYAEDDGGPPEDNEGPLLPVSCRTTQDLWDAMECSTEGKTNNDDHKDSGEVEEWEALADKTSEEAWNIVVNNQADTKTKIAEVARKEVGVCKTNNDDHKDTAEVEEWEALADKSSEEAWNIVVNNQADAKTKIAEVARKEIGVCKQPRGAPTRGLPQSSSAASAALADLPCEDACDALKKQCKTIDEEWDITDARQRPVGMHLQVSAVRAAAKTCAPDESLKQPCNLTQSKLKSTNHIAKKAQTKMAEIRFQGKFKGREFNKTKRGGKRNYGFIEVNPRDLKALREHPVWSSNLEEDVFWHSKDCSSESFGNDGQREGDIVTFTVILKLEGGMLQAQNVELKQRASWWHAVAQMEV